MARIAQRNDLGGSEDVLFRSLLDQRGIKILKTNIQYFIETSHTHGDKKDLARKISVTQSTLSKWLSGDHVPRQDHLEKLCQYLGLPGSTDLKMDPIFL